MSTLTKADAPAGSSLARPDNVPLRPPDAALDFGPTLVIAPHPDDESLGCGGAIALLRAAGMPVTVLFVSDGSGSHPRSRRYPAAALRDLREREARAALAILGVAPAAISFLRARDRFVPRVGEPGFALLARRVGMALAAARPRTVLVPWRRDPHGDHRASHELLSAALAGLPAPPRVVEYAIWVWELGAPEDWPRAGEVAGWRLDIRPALDDKLAAIAAHVSQTTALIDDDPTGFRLGERELRHFRRPWELYLDPLDGLATL